MLLFHTNYSNKLLEPHGDTIALWRMGTLLARRGQASSCINAVKTSPTRGISYTRPVEGEFTSVQALTILNQAKVIVSLPIESTGWQVPSLCQSPRSAATIFLAMGYTKDAIAQVQQSIQHQAKYKLDECWRHALPRQSTLVGCAKNHALSMPIIDKARLGL